MIKMRCPECQQYEGVKVITFGLPMKICESCSTLWGEPFATIYIVFLMPIEAMFSDSNEFCFFSYEGNYFVALWDWLRGDDGHQT